MSTTQELLNILEDTASLLQKTQVNLKKCPKSRLTKGFIETRIKTIEDYWINFKRAHHELVKITPKDQKALLPYFVNEEFFIYEDLYLILLGDLRDMLTTSHSSTSSHNSSVESNTEKQNTLVRLPRIQLPTFSGKYEEWQTFQDLFISLVHTNTSISDVQKLHYLKCSVTGEAETLLKHVQVTQKNYEQAWLILKTRYGNKRLIINSVLKQLFNQRKITSQSPNQIKILLDVTSDCLNNLQNLDICTDSWDPLIIFLVVQKLDPESHKDWEQFAYKDESDNLPTWNDLKKFLQSTYRTLELIASGTRDKTTRESVHHISNTSPSRPSSKTCIMCKGDHTLCHCKDFTKLQPIERTNYVKKNNLCYNCLSPGHSVVTCRLPMSCRICKRRHHSLLHQNKETDSSAPESSIQPKTSYHTVEEQEQINVNTMVTSHHSVKQGIALLATATVTVRNDQNHTVILRALVDPGSQTALISEKATQMLYLTKHSARGSIIGVGATKTNVNHVVQLQIGSRWNKDFKMDVEAYVMSKQLTSKLPPKTVSAGHWPHLEGLNLADSNYDTPGPIDLLLGVKEYCQIIQEQLIKGPPGTPCAQKTYLGWILFGNVDAKPQDNSILVLHQQFDMDIMLKSLWEMDTERERRLTKEERLCEAIYDETHTRTEEGRYMVKLPLKTPRPRCLEGNTKDLAKNRLLQLERKFRRSPHLKENYKKVMDEYLSLKYMEEIPEIEITNVAVYLPHHAVIREDKETSKTRVVFDASAKGKTNVSLNDELLVGPQLQEDLRNIIMRWRMKRVGYASDITKMYLQICVYPEDANNYQRILWRENEEESIKEFRLLRVTFGTASAPYLAVKTLHQVADDEGQLSPKAVKTIKEDFLMDDLLGGEDTVNEAIETASQVSHILNKAGFTLTKWSSNCTEFLKCIKTNNKSPTAQLDINKIDGTVKALGLVWNLKTDQFQYQLRLPTTSGVITKRVILSEVQKLFDPLGWIAPSLILAKMFIQKLWLEKVDWDDSISSQLQREWIIIREDFKNVNNIYIYRWLGTLSTELKAVQIHGFSDASVRAYAAVAYVRTETQDGHIITRLIAARTRVAPLKTVSLPRLELSGALLLSRLLKQIVEAMRIPITQTFAWTDSAIVIAWLSGEPHRWKSFVANRVTEIIDNLNDNRWYHVASEENPADIASRGMLLADLKSSELWWNGPTWLSEKEIVLKLPDKMSTDLEKKKDRLETNTKIINEEEYKSLASKFTEFDSIQELIKVMTYCKRFLNYKRNSDTYPKCFTTEELHQSLMTSIKIVQGEEFTDEISRLKSNKNVRKNSNLKALTPYLDQDGILRVGGRLRHANLDQTSKNPIILGHNNNLVRLIIADAHAQTLHGGVHLMLCFLRSKFWIIRAKSLVKDYNRKCLVCARQRATARTQIMGDLPKQRVTPTRAFLYSGVDFTGPFHVLSSKGRGMKTHKAYIAVFVCMSTKAIHLELVGDLSTEAFIAAYRRFVARRGKCSHMWSDQGRNFVGAEKDLATAWQEAQLNLETDVANKLALEGTQWHFIPAYSPNFGGLWEAGVKSLKHHLKRVLTTNLTFEEMTTVLCQIEACLNSRPLCLIDESDTDSIEPLTPGHFLIHEAPIVVPSPDFKDTKFHNLSRWQYTQKLVGDIWRRWYKEYLTTLQQRSVWNKKSTEFNIGDIVLIKVDGLPPGKWSLGRIVDKHPGDDGLTRVYSVKSGNSIVKRSVSKLCPLPINTEFDST